MFILSEHSGAIGTLTLNQPARRNALSETLVEELIVTLTDVQQAGIRVVVLRTASGASVWSSGSFVAGPWPARYRRSGGCAPEKEC